MCRFACVLQQVEKPKQVCPFAQTFILPPLHWKTRQDHQREVLKVVAGVWDHQPKPGRVLPPSEAPAPAQTMIKPKQRKDSQSRSRFNLFEMKKTSWIFKCSFCTQPSPLSCLPHAARRGPVAPGRKPSPADLRSKSVAPAEPSPWSILEMKMTIRKKTSRGKGNSFSVQ